MCLFLPISCFPLFFMMHFVIEIYLPKYSMSRFYSYFLYIMHSYDNFWDLMKWAYPISKWTMKLPISANIIHIESLDTQKILIESKRIIQDLCNRFSDSETAKHSLIQENWEHGLKNLLSNTFTWVIRLDCVLDQEGKAKILEINADYPDGLLMHDFTYSALSWTPITKNLDMFTQLFDISDSILILYKKWTFFLDAYYTEYNLLKKLWYACYIWTEEDLDFVDWLVYFEEHIIDVIRRCMEVGKFDEWLLHQLSLCMVKFTNSFDLRVLWYKNLLPEIESPFIPKTFSLQDHHIDILLEQKDKYIIKPSNLFEWKGIHIGKYCEHEDRKSALKTSVDNNYIVQEFVDMQKMKVQLYENWWIIEKELYFDICPHIFVKDWTIIGDGLVLMRFSENRILNVAKWWWIWYLKI